MKRFLFLLAAAALALPATAFAKGPSDATITGPGLSKAIKIAGPESDGSAMMDFAEAAGFFPAAFGQTPVVTTSTRPKGDLGPKYSIEYAVPNGGVKPDRLHQDLYPYAKPGRVDVHAGGPADLRHEDARGLVHRHETEGDSRRPRAAQVRRPGATSTSADSAGFFSTGKIGAVLLVLFGIGAAAVLTRRHLRRTATT